MNKQRRKRAQQIKDELAPLLAQVEELRDEEEESLDNIPYSLRNSEKATVSEDALTILEHLASDLEDHIDQLDELIQ